MQDKEVWLVLEQKRMLTVDSYEHNLLLNALMEYRNQLLKENKSTKTINELILRVLHTPIKKSIFKKESVYERWFGNK